MRHPDGASHRRERWQDAAFRAHRVERHAWTIATVAVCDLVGSVDVAGDSVDCALPCLKYANQRVKMLTSNAARRAFMTLPMGTAPFLDLGPTTWTAERALGSTCQSSPRVQTCR